MEQCYDEPSKSSTTPWTQFAPVWASNEVDAGHGWYVHMWIVSIVPLVCSYLCGLLFILTGYLTTHVAGTLVVSMSDIIREYSLFIMSGEEGATLQQYMFLFSKFRIARHTFPRVHLKKCIPSLRYNYII